MRITYPTDVNPYQNEIAQEVNKLISGPATEKEIKFFIDNPAKVIDYVAQLNRDSLNTLFPGPSLATEAASEAEAEPIPRRYGRPQRRSGESLNDRLMRNKEKFETKDEGEKNEEEEDD